MLTKKISYLVLGFMILIHFSGIAQPVADFTFSPDSVCPGTEICFINQSTGDTSGIFDFNNGIHLTGDTVCMIYFSSGVYMVELKVKGIGGKDSITKPVTILNQPDADFEVDTTTVQMPDATVNFTNTTQYGANATWQWDFGDSNTDTKKDPPHTYNTAGTYTVSLIATDTAVGCADTITKADYILVQQGSGISPPWRAGEAALSVPGNPAGNRLQVQFVLTEAAAVTIRMYDLSGRPVHTLVRDGNYSPGTYTLETGALRSLATGMYILQLHTEKTALREKVVILR